MAKKIDIERLVIRGIYRVNAHNFDLAVYDGEGGFLGIRVSDGNRHIFTERANMSVTLVEGPFGFILRDVPLDETLGFYCSNCKARCSWAGKAVCPNDCPSGSIQANSHANVRLINALDRAAKLEAVAA